MRISLFLLVCLIGCDVKPGRFVEYSTSVTYCSITEGRSYRFAFRSFEPEEESDLQSIVTDYPYGFRSSQWLGGKVETIEIVVNNTKYHFQQSWCSPEELLLMDEKERSGRAVFVQVKKLLSKMLEST